MVLAILLGPYLKDIWFFSYSYARIDAVSNLKTIICPSIIETNNQIEGKNNDFYNLSDEQNIDVTKPTKKKCIYKRIRFNWFYEKIVGSL